MDRKATGLRKYEVGELPFDNIRIGAFYEICEKAEAKDDQGNSLGYILYSSLKKGFMDNEEWMSALKTGDSPTSRLLLGEGFRHEGVEDAIKLPMILSAGLLYCQTN